MAFIFGPGPAINPVTGDLIAGATGNLFQDAAGTTPVTDATINGVPVSSATSDENAVIPQIMHDTIDTLYWKSGTVTLGLTSSEGLRDAAVAAQVAAEAAQAAAEAALEAVQDAENGIEGAPTSWPQAFPPIIGAGPNDAFPGDGNMDGRYYTKDLADARYAPAGSTGGGDATLDGIPSLIRVQVGGVYPPRGTARADLQIIWQGATPPASATVASGADFVNEPIALSRGTGQGPDRFEAVS